MKRCIKCGVEKDLEKFYKGNGKFGRNNWCKKCCKKYYQTEQGKLVRNKAYKKYYQNNKEKIAKQHKKYRQENKEKIKIRDRKYFQTEQGKLAHQKGRYKRRSLLKKHLNTLTLQDWNQILESQNHKCAMCGKSFKKVKPTKDHILPLSKGGHTTKENIQALCQRCNSKKGAKLNVLF